MKHTPEEIAEIIALRDIAKKRIIKGFKNNEYHNEKQLAVFKLYFECDYYYELMKENESNIRT